MAIKNQLCTNWHHTLQNLDTNNIQDTWRITKHLTNDYSNIPPLKLNNESAITKQENVNLFADTLQDIFASHLELHSSITSAEKSMASENTRYIKNATMPLK
jgi:hypothetical protein